ncbi:hypothetical protein PCORN_18686 [Listeria cornellensis FSL F6-0969]|uniref:Uncharacterized protein n=1 Tax=Listeria cornellensis FSL F6-0969 TaxID=1265820 RepID=W7BHT8_9LIST|nr:hypothetical protein PCORN_18686 [Listeria cornellensis FSL F6-0969]
MWRFEKSEVMAKIMSLQEGYLYHYYCMLERYRAYEGRIILNDETDEQRLLLVLRNIGERFGDYIMSEDRLVIPPFFY